MLTIIYIIYKNILNCGECIAPCCKYPVIKGPSSGIEQSISWVHEGVGEFPQGSNLDDYIDSIRQILEEVIKPPDFFSGTNKPQRELQLMGIELVFDLDFRTLFFRVLFFCPVFDEEAGICSDYEDRPLVCRRFLCEDAGGSNASIADIQSTKVINTTNFHPNIDQALIAVHKIITDNFL